MTPVPQGAFFPAAVWSQCLQATTQLFLQQNCPLCDRPTPQPCCPTCWQQLQTCAQTGPACPAEAALPVLAWGTYEGPLKRAIAALKYDGYRSLAVPLGRSLGDRWQQYPIQVSRRPQVVPIPLHGDKQRQRGFNQADLLAEAFCQHTGLPLSRQGLMRQRATAPQFGLNPAARQQNLAEAFALGPAFQTCRSQAPVLLLDDIYTTGTTVRTAAALLRRWGISVCGVVVIAQATMGSERLPLSRSPSTE